MVSIDEFLELTETVITKAQWLAAVTSAQQSVPESMEVEQGSRDSSFKARLFCLIIVFNLI